MFKFLIGNQSYYNGKSSYPRLRSTQLDEISKGIYGLRVLIVNVYIIFKPDNSWVLVDTGLPYSAGRIKEWAEQKMGKAQSLKP